MEDFNFVTNTGITYVHTCNENNEQRNLKTEY